MKHRNAIAARRMADAAHVPYLDQLFDDRRADQIVKVGRNEACPCGSGRKFKKCCGSAPTLR
jgi:uncharacterized protein YecA (UPF0149 family)